MKSKNKILAVIIISLITTVGITAGIIIYIEIQTNLIPSENNPPVINEFYPLNDPIIFEMQSQIFNVSASDPDGTLLTYLWTLNNTSVGSNFSSYTFNANYNSNGTYLVKIIITDGEDSIEHNWTLTINNVNRAPQIISTYPSSNFVEINELEQQDFEIVVLDEDNDPLTIWWYVNGVLKQTGGNYTFTTDYNSTGTYKVKVNVTDGKDNIQNNWTLTVKNVNRAPIADIVNDNVVSNVGWFVKFNGSDSYDPDGNEDIDTFLWDFGDGSFGTGKLTNHSYSDPSDYTVKLIVNDSANAINQDEVNVTVQDYVEEELESDHNIALGEHIGQIFEVSPSLFIYNIKVYVIYANLFESVYANITLELRGINGLLEPNQSIYKKVEITHIQSILGQADGWITIPIDGFYITNDIYVVTRVDNWGGDSYYTLAGGSENDLITKNYDAGSWGVLFYDQAMNITYQWANATSDVNTPPQAHIVNEDVVSNVDWKVMFNASDSWDANGLNDIDTYHWDFGDGSYGFGTEMNHTYTVAGIYRVILTVNDSFNVKSQDWVWVTVQDYVEIEIETGHVGYIAKTDKVAQLLDFDKSFYLYNITIYAKKKNDLPVTANLTLELQGVDMLIKPNGTILYSKTITNISEGWINVPINGYYVEDQIFVVTYIDNIESIAYYSVAHNAGTSDDEETLLDSGTGFTTIGINWDQTMNVTIQWANITSDVAKDDFNFSIPSFMPLTLLDYNSTLYVLVYVLGFTDFHGVIKRFKKSQNKPIKLDFIIPQ